MNYSIQIEPNIVNLDPKKWNACAHDKLADKLDSLNPFISFEFLSALERSGSANARTGWAGAHLILEDTEHNMLAACPAYLKNNSMGEYVFDHAWADAYARAGGEYYPKLQISVPFTPATAPKLLSRDDDLLIDTRRAIISAIPALCDKIGASSAHATFLTELDRALFLEVGFLERNDKQYH